MRGKFNSTLRCTLALAGVLLWIANAGADPAAQLPRLASPGDSGPAVGLIQLPSQGFSPRDLTGLRLPLRQGAFNRMGLVSGVSHPTPGSRSLSSGLYWRVGAPDGRRAAMQLLQSGIEGEGRDGSELLLQTAASFPTGDNYFLPDLTTEFAAVRRTRRGASTMAGTALRVGLQGALADVVYRLRLSQSDPGFQPLGSTLSAGRTVADASARYQLNPDSSIQQSLRLSRTAAGASNWSNSVLLTAPPPRLLDGFESLRLEADLQMSELSPQSATDSNLRIALGGDRWQWHYWQLASAVAWEEARTGSMSSQRERYSWLFAGDRDFRLGRFAGTLRSQLALQHEPGGTESGWQTSAGVGMVLDRLTRNLSLNLDYLADSLRAGADGGEAMRVMLRYNVNAGGLLSGLGAAFDRLRPGA